MAETNPIFLTSYTIPVTGLTLNSPPIDSLLEKKDKLTTNVKQLQQIGLPPISTIGKQVWNNMIKPILLSERQIMKKVILMSSQSFPIPITEEDAQLIVYGKIYYRDGKLYDNDNEDDICVSKPGDEDYEPPIDQNHPLWKKTIGQIEDLKNSLEQLGIKLGEFMFAQPNAIANMVISLVALASSVTILPFGAGLPTALSAVQTMMKTIKDLQAKTAEILPLLVPLDMLGLILPKSAQAVIAQVNIIIALYLGVLTAITAILGILDNITKKLEKFKKKVDNRIKVSLKATPNPSPSRRADVKLSVEAGGGDYQFTYKWTDALGNTIPLDININPDDDDGTRIVKPQVTTIYRCRVVDSNGSATESAIPIVVL